jgi:hypothetical protein
MADFDFSEIEKLAADLGEVPKGAGAFVSKATEVSARKVKDSWRKKLTGARYLPRAAASIAYEIKGGQAIRGSTITVEIAPRLGGQGSLVHIVEFGALSTSPRGYGRAALQENQEEFVQGLLTAVEDAQRAAGL